MRNPGPDYNALYYFIRREIGFKKSVIFYVVRKKMTFFLNPIFRRMKYYGTYSPVYVPTDQDNAIKEFIRMRDDAQIMLKQTKQQINGLCLRHGKIFDGNSRWTPKHM